MSEKNVTEATRLNRQQLEMISLFKNPMSEQDYNEIKRLAVKLLAKNIDDEIERLETEGKLTFEVYEKWGSEHMRTPYTK